MTTATQNFIRQNRYKFFTVGAVGTFMGTLDGSIVNVALPTIATDLNCTISLVAWVVLSYVLTLVSLLVIFGAWAERRGYDFAYRFGFIFFTLGSALCSVSWSIYSLILGRIIQAIGTSMFQAVGVGMVTEVFPASERGKGIGMMVMMVSAGLMAGPPIGGLLVDFFPWQSIFLINIPIGLVGFALTLRYFKALPKPTVTRALHLGSGIAISVALFCWTFGLSMVSDYGLASARVWGLILLAAVSMVLFINYERQPDRALIGTSLIRNWQFSSALAAAVLMFVAMAGPMILIPFYLEQILHFAPKTVGLFLTIFPLCMFIVAPQAGRISDRIGSRGPATAGMAVLVVGLYILSRVGADTSSLYLIAAFTTIGIGVSIFNTPNSSSIMGAVSPGQRAVTSGVISTSRNIGMSTGVALGTALFSFFQNQYAQSMNETAAFLAGYHRVIYVAMAFGILALPLCIARKR